MSNMNVGTEQFGEFSKTAVDSAMQFAKVSMDSAERMFALNLEAAKVGLDQGAKSTKAATSVKDVQEFNGLRTKAAETGLEFFMGYSKNLYDISNFAQAQYSALVEERVSAFQKTVAEGIDKAAKNAPAGTDVAFAALKSSMAASTAAMDTLSKASKQVSAFTDTAIKSATETATKATASKRK
ncbi:MAG: phasin family protein [Betaproteobacteria bacterium]